jgi:hypothetical protein
MASYVDELTRLADELRALAASPPERVVADLAPLLNRGTGLSAEYRLAYARSLAANQLVDEEGGQRGAQVRAAKRAGLSEAAFSRVVLGQPRQATR